MSPASTPAVTGTVAELLSFPLEPGSTHTATSPYQGSETPDVQALIALARSGDQAAFGRLVDLYQRVAVRTALAAVGRREDAEYVAQEAFLMAWRKLGAFRGEASFRTWLLTIVWRKALDRRRTQLLWWRRTAPHPETEPFESIPGAAATPEREAVARDSARRVRQEISNLSPTLRDTLLLAASGEYTYEQIAEVLGVPLGTIKWRVSEARRRISERLGR